MDTRTGKIISYDDLQKLADKEKKHFVEVPEQYEQFLLNMNRKDRRAWYRRNKEKFNKYGRPHDAKIL